MLILDIHVIYLIFSLVHLTDMSRHGSSPCRNTSVKGSKREMLL